jgi:hypothetical protein
VAFEKHSPDLLDRSGLLEGCAPDPWEAPNSSSHHSEYMRFERHVKGKRSKFPKALKDQYKEDKLSMFQVWLSHNEDFGKVTVYFRKLNQKKKRARNMFGWKTRDDLMDMYHGKENIVDSIITKKIAAHLMRSHPEDPTNAEMNRYWVLTESSYTIDDIQIEEDGMEGEAEVEREDAEELAEQFTTRMAAPMISCEQTEQSIDLVGNTAANMAIPTAQGSIPTWNRIGKGNPQTTEHDFSLPPINRVHVVMFCYRVWFEKSFRGGGSAEMPTKTSWRRCA